MDILWIMQTRVWRVLVSDLFSLLLVGIGLPTMVLLSIKGELATPLEPQVQQKLVALEANSRETLALVTKLQSETTARIERVRSIEKELAALQQQRTLLELSPDQRRAIESLVERPTHFWNLFLTWEFWINSVLVSVVTGTFFYFLGRRRGTQRPATTS
jgi:hypothetical protein